MKTATFGSSSFADDVEDVARIAQRQRPSKVQALDKLGRRFAYVRSGSPFAIEISERGVAILSRGTFVDRPDATERSPACTVGRVLAATAIDSALSKKGTGWAANLVLGLLVRAVPSDTAAPKKAEKVLTMRFDVEARTWEAYDGGLVTRMKSELLGGSLRG